MNATTKPVKIYSQIDAVELFQQIDAVEINSQHKPVKSSSADNFYRDSELIRIAFYIHRHEEKVRQVIALNGFELNALMQAKCIGKKEIPKWVQFSVNSWADFNSELPITKQIKMFLIRELTARLK